MKFTEEQLKEYARPISETEESKCKNAIRMVGDALKDVGFEDKNTLEKMHSDSTAYQLRMKSNDGYEVKIFMQGSYANNTNVRQHSDVDIAIVQEDQFRTKYRVGVTDSNYHFLTAIPKNHSFKDVVERGLKEYFGNDIKRGNKSIKVVGNTYRKDADAVPCVRLRDYTNDYSDDSENYVGGIIIRPDIGTEIINYPEQHLSNGVEKNINTGRRYKKMVRIAKELRYQMKELSTYNYAKEMSSFGVECLLWNIPDEVFNKWEFSYCLIFNEVVNYLYTHKHEVENFKEVNGIKKIADDDYDRINVYQGFIEELKRFYLYE